MGDPDRAFRTLDELGVAPTLLAIARENFTKTQAMLAPFVALLSLENDVTATGVRNDPTPVETVIYGVPSWALDQYTRPGKQALRRLCRENAGMADWLHAYVPPRSRVRVAGELLFRAEGQCLALNAEGPLGQHLRDRWVRHCLGLPREATAAGMTVMRAAIPELNAIRAEVVREGVA